MRAGIVHRVQEGRQDHLHSLQEMIEDKERVIACCILKINTDNNNKKAVPAAVLVQESVQVTAFSILLHQHDVIALLRF